ncbi:16S rRNA (uracil(1498)-N(3))-methyltransferase [Saccharibacillus sp. CPCC 101409]|uniref:16S rRNA (uracil(1498)-N(3))-methyltransferase n=1 Tax=Saccharibacillus sp. CPCC 101409 TaxID=3058041 RepID=UPI00267213BD|nr:16S rRNA (uracil(1498)-N(3))-methyltransferase [Saccharibacillus sp. CPCC 101409]MDO3409155.1 16S rRNA (uracil(1498)-N(3))-methyltransferase [Saccharibacillus sp. CPCC 101409]
MQRYFVEKEQFEHDKVRVLGEDARHIGKVMRGRPGDQIIVCDGAGRVALAELESIEQGEVLAGVLEELEDRSEARVRVSIAQSLPKGDKLETVIQKCTEIGAHAFVPFLSERTVVQYDAKKEEKRLQRWSKIAKEAAEQSHRSRIPELSQPLTYRQLLQSFERYDLVLFCYEKEDAKQLRDLVRPFAESCAEGASSVLVVVGPEGGFTEKEAETAAAAGASITGLGRRILRAETAGMTALACILYEAGEMGGV